MAAVYPSNVDVVTRGKLQQTDDNPENIGLYYTGELIKSGRYNAPAPNGHYILDPWTLDRANQSGVAISNSMTTARPSCVAFYGGRAWWSGVKDPQYVGTLFFTQLLDSDNKIGRCYQENDPTSDILSDLLDTDGGVIPIPECGHVLRLLNVNDALIVFATNGIWSVSGSSGSGFSATGYATRKVSRIGVISPESIVEAEQFVFFWSDSGIYRLVPDNITGYLTPENITLSTVQTFYNDLAAVAKFQVFGMYDNTEKRVWWYYNPNLTYSFGSGGEGGGTEGGFPTRYTNAIVFDLALEAFYPHEFGDDDFQYVAGAAMSSPSGRNALECEVLIGSDNVVIGGDNVVITSFESIASQQIHKVLIGNLDSLNFGISFADYTSTTFMDFAGYGEGADYTSYMETGYSINGTAAADTSLIYVIPVFNRTEKSYTVTGLVGDPATEAVWSWDDESACTMFAKWDWTSNSLSRKWSFEEEAYRLIEPFSPTLSISTHNYTGGQEVVNNKLRVRGQGTSLQLRFESQSGKDMQLLGWQHYGEQTTNP